MNERLLPGVVAVVVGIAGACSSGAGTGPTAAQRQGRDSARTQVGEPAMDEVTWVGCDDPTLWEGECAALEVPLDYAEPHGPSIDMAMFRIRARAERIGTLVVNPGGPGASGIAYVRDGAGLFPAGFDVIGFDPRGVGRSNPVECVSERDIDRWYGSAAAPRDTAELNRWLEDAARQAVNCSSSDLGAMIGTTNVARDIDRIRAALGEERINFVGFSYGARLGWTYATMFPNRVRAMVLDGPEDPAGDFAQSTVQQAAAYEQVLAEFVAFCAVVPGRCPDDPAAAIVEVIRRADMDPLPTDPGLGPLSGTYALNAVLTSFYDEGAWPELGSALRAALDGDGAPMLQLSFFWSDRHNPDPYVTVDAQQLISCADRPERPSTSDLDVVRRKVADVSPTFDDWIPGSVPPCYGYAPALEPTPAPGSVDLPPVLVVSSTGDVATPLAGAQHLVDALGNAVLLIRDGTGHTSYGQSPCIDGHVARYLTDLTFPQPGTTCS